MDGTHNIIAALLPLATPIEELHLDPANARTGHDVERIAASLRQYGQRKPIVVNRREGNKVEAGSGTLQAARLNGWTHVAAVFVEDDPMTAVGYAIADNRTAELSRWDLEALQTLLDSLPPEYETGFAEGELEALLQSAGLDGDCEPTGANEAEEGAPTPLAGLFEELPLPEGVPDGLWPTDNEWGVPLLSLERQADALDVPVDKWGARGRRQAGTGTYHFYTEDYRFSGLWTTPDAVPQSGCVNAVEPNFSVSAWTPRAVALWATFRKRWLARYWQSQGIRIFVDLNVARPHDDINMLGVPRGWRAYATRAYSERMEDLDIDLAVARTHAGGQDVLFVVYGGNTSVQEWCLANGAIWVPHHMDAFRSRYLNAGEVREVNDG